MQLDISISSANKFTFPIHYNHIVQSFVYNCFHKVLANFIHNEGYIVGSRTFKLFVFSRLIGEYQIDKAKGIITFGKKLNLMIASPIDEICHSLCNNLLNEPHLLLGSHPIIINKVDIQKQKIVADKIKIVTKSPITVYSTLLRPNGKKYTCYFQPGEKDFDRQITANLQKKFLAIYKREPPQGKINLSPLGYVKMNIIKYKEFVIKGYSGKFIMRGPTEILQTALDAGLGAKNSQGFGFITLI